MRGVLLAAIVALSATVAVSASARSAAPPTKKPGTLIVGFDLPAPAFWNGRATGTTIRNPSGFEYDLAVAIQKKLRLKKIEFLRAPFGTIFSPAPKKFDFALEETTITAARSKVITFSVPYFEANQGVLIRKGLAKPKRVDDLKKLQLCAQKDTTGLAYIVHKLRPAKQPLIYAASTTAAFDAVEGGRCDALILDTPIVVSQAKKKPGAYGGVIGQIVTGEGYGAIMEKGSKMKPFVDKAIKALKKSGTLAKLQKKWLPFTKVPILK